MTINIQEEATQVMVTLEGRLDTMASTEHAPTFQQINALASKTIVLDCSNLEYISSSGLRLFLTVRKSAQAMGGKVIVKNINEEIKNVFTMTGFINLFIIE